MMTPTRPYFLRAVYEWILDNECTPFLAVNADAPGVEVPREYVEDGQITLNLAPSAIVDLQMTNDGIEFSARFSGVAQLVRVPMVAVMGIFARENGQGMAFPDEPGFDVDIIEGGADEDKAPEPLRSIDGVQASDSEVQDETAEVDTSDDDPEPPRPSGRPQLKVVK
ncbi:Stringent starvation protein B [BD1-7 clade bacterium]|uniref:Stringent starvation protein B n=1 Tax=BD1-7 clade bacterium TaxID=2029982 RepID=A0A5S9QB77_9GAMM|nr:Stringent starvation protein B [BD1-7 clade bacterium]CAA0115374.1 Stringent starvation protein B [BD1-7 clade bacterium]